jgi:hypothetical protein
MGRIFDDCGNRMTPSHSNRDGVRYRYYVSHVLLQRRKTDAGRVVRVPAIQLEKLLVEAVRAKARPDTEPKDDLSDRGVIDRYVTRVIVRPNSIDIELREPTPAPTPSLATEAPVTASAAASSTCTTPDHRLPIGFGNVSLDECSPERAEIVDHQVHGDVVGLLRCRAGHGTQLTKAKTNFRAVGPFRGNLAVAAGGYKRLIRGRVGSHPARALDPHPGGKNWPLVRRWYRAHA